MMKLNRNFNRLETDLENIYLNKYGTNANTGYQYTGLVKCRLVHSQDSVIMPDLIFIKTKDNNFIWFQPFTFFINLLVEEEDIIRTGVCVDISAGNTLKIVFTNKDWIRNFDDDSSLFNCQIYGPQDIEMYSTGTGYFENWVPYIFLYHHTTKTTIQKIHKSQCLKGSKWNIQGTREIKNINYFYLTSLPAIQRNGDLLAIAMASDGKINLILDQAPERMNYDDFPDEILTLEVYRENTYNRNSTLKFVVNATILSPRHLWKHRPVASCVFYEVCMAFIFRIGVIPDKTLSFGNGNVIDIQDNIQMIDYHIIGEGTTKEGLKAPIDEEIKDFVFKIQPLEKLTNILEFWFAHSNTDLYSTIPMTPQKFV